MEQQVEISNIVCSNDCLHLFVMKIVHLLLGSNMGDSQGLLQTATARIEEIIGKVMKSSAFYRTAAWGNMQQPDFLNQVIEVETMLSPEDLLRACLSIEEQMGRKRTVKNAPRLIDIDILFCGDLVLNKNGLQIPHPEIPNRRFVLVPLVELSADFMHPALGKTMQALLEVCADRLPVNKN